MDNNKINIIIGVNEEIIFIKLQEFLTNNLSGVSIFPLTTNILTSNNTPPTAAHNIVNTETTTTINNHTTNEKSPHNLYEETTQTKSPTLTSLPSYSSKINNNSLSHTNPATTATTSTQKINPNTTTFKVKPIYTTKNAPTLKIIYVIEENFLTNLENSLLTDTIILIKKDSSFVNTNNYKVIYFPLRLDDLLAYLQQIIDKINNDITVNNFTLKNNKKCWLVKNLNNKSSIELTDKEGLLLKTLLKNYPYPCNRTELLKTVWNITSLEVETHTLESHISSLRKKLAKITTNSSNACDNGLEVIKNEDGYLVNFTYSAQKAYLSDKDKKQ